VVDRLANGAVTPREGLAKVTLLKRLIANMQNRTIETDPKPLK
jgi:hypothetical protein